MAKRPFMEMDLDEFEEKKDEGVIDEPSLDFDFDEDIEETTPDVDSTDVSMDDTNISDDEQISNELSELSTDYDDLLNDDNNTDDQSIDEPVASEDDITNEPTEELSIDDESEPIQEGALTNGIGRIRNELAKALAGKYVVSNLNPKTDEFNIKEQGGDFNSPTTYCTPTNNGLKVVTRGVGIPMKPHFASIPLSQAFEKIKALFDKPELLTAESYVMEAWDPYTIDEAKNELKKWRNVYLNLDSWKRNYDIKKIEPEFDKLEKEVLSKMKTTHDLLRVEHGNFYLYPKSWKGSTYGDGKKLDDFEYVMKVSGVHDEEPHFLYDKYDPDGKLISESHVMTKAVTKFPYPSRFFQETEEESTDDEEPEIPEMPDLSVDDTDNDDDSGEVEVTAEVEEKITPDGEDLSSFGMDTSDVQNDFDQKDIDSLNKLIAAESEAINDYFDASKDTRNEDLRTLFSDIGHEERFHLEQLMYSKAKLTGEKYEPRDPKVKEEYEELINGGMDEDTAAYTAMDKASMLPDDDGDDSDMEELEQESALICNMLYNNELLVSICEHYVSNDTITRDKNVAMFVEGYIMESIDNVSSAPKEMTKIKSPFSILAKGLGVAIAGLAKMSSIARDSMRRSNLKRARRKEWIQKHGIAELFKAGISLYLYNDKTNTMDFNTPCRYVDFLYRLTKAIGETCGIQLTQAAKHKSVPDPIKFTSVKEGMYKLSQVVFTKTKVVVTDANKTALQNEFFGYNDNKLNVAVTHGTDQVVRDSANIYNRLDAMILIIKQYAEISKAVLDQLSKLEGDVNSVYYKNRPVYNKAKDNMTEVIKKYNQFISATSHDLNQIMKLDNGLLKMTRERDMTEQGGGKWEGPDIRVNPKTQQQDPKYTQMKKKKGLFH